MPAPINTWHHLVSTRGAGNAYKMYIDGNLAFTGRIDEVAIYNTELSASRVAAHYSAAVTLNSIGLNFVGGGNGSPGDGQTRTLSSGQVAGVVPQSNWNNITGASNTASNLIGDNGLPTTLDISYTANATYSTGNGSGTANHILMNGYVDEFGDDGSPVINYQVSEVPFLRYDVYVYTDSDAADSRDESFSLLSSSGQLFDSIFVSDEANFNGTFIRATATTLNGVGAQGNYVLFQGVVGDSFTLTGTAMGFRNFVNGIQIVDTFVAVPEPTTGLLMLVGIAGAAMRRRRET